MAADFYPKYPPELTEAAQQHLLTNIKDWSIAHGLAVRPSPAFVPSEQDPGLALATTAPVTLFPSLFPRRCFDQGVSIQTAYNKLYSAIARDEKWLQPIIEE
jgi:glutathione synthase